MIGPNPVLGKGPEQPCVALAGEDRVDPVSETPAPKVARDPEEASFGRIGDRDVVGACLATPIGAVKYRQDRAHRGGLGRASAPAGRAPDRRARISPRA